MKGARLMVHFSLREMSYGQIPWFSASQAFVHINHLLFFFKCGLLCRSSGVRVCVLSGVRLVVTQWTITRQALASMGFSRQEYWSGLPFPSPGDLPDPGIEPPSPASSALQANSLPVSHWGSPSSGMGLDNLYFQHAIKWWQCCVDHTVFE